MTVVTVHYVMSGNPIPQKSEVLHYVQLDSWDPDNPYDDESNLPPDQVTYLDATALLRAGAARRQVATFKLVAWCNRRATTHGPLRSAGVRRPLISLRCSTCRSSTAADGILRRIQSTSSSSSSIAR